jgi:hypothetical protein
MSFKVRIHCGGLRKDFLLARGKVMDNGDIEPGPAQEFATKEAAIAAGHGSTCVQTMGWPFTVEDARDTLPS